MKKNAATTNLCSIPKLFNIKKMKKIILLALLALTGVQCTKEGIDPVASLQQPLNTEDRDNCQCAVRVNSNDGNTSEEFSARHTYRIVTKGAVPFSKYLGSLECGGQNMVYDQWYPVGLIPNVVYQLQYGYQNTNCNTLAPNVASISIACGGNIRTFPLATGNTAATNPALLGFQRSGCQILETE